VRRYGGVVQRGRGGGGRRGHPLPGRAPGQAVQLDPIKHKLKPHGTKRWKLEYYVLRSNAAFKFNLCRYNPGSKRCIGFVSTKPRKNTFKFGK
jgi:hypothetical protein